MRFAFALLLAVGSLSAAPIPKELKKPDDKEAVLGSWKPVSFNGKPQGATAWFRFAADGTMRTWHGPNAANPIDWKWSLDPAAGPKRMKLSHPGGPVGETAVFDCVYELDGDTLKIGFVVNAKAELPAKVELHPALQLYELTRAKDAK